MSSLVSSLKTWKNEINHYEQSSLKYMDFESVGNA